MRLGQRPSFLVLHSEERADKRRLEIVPKFSAAIRAWTAGTRISPIWGIQEFGTEKPAKRAFQGRHHLIFIGPVAPARLYSDIPAASPEAALQVWVTAGCMDLLVHVDSNPEGDRVAGEIVAWTKRCKFAFEKWLVRDGAIVDVTRISTPIVGYSETLTELARLADDDHAPELRATLQEFCALMSSAIARSALVSRTLHEELVRVSGAMVLIIKDGKARENATLETHSRLLSMNAALSRFSSQAFSGIPPITETELHFWIYSLLGTGAANIALNRLAGYVEAILGEARLPERIAAMRHRTHDVPDLDQLTNDPDFLVKDHLRELISRLPSFVRPGRKRLRRAAGPAAFERSAASADAAWFPASWGSDRKACSPDGTTNGRAAWRCWS